jgi:hypothetical protein
VKLVIDKGRRRPAGWWKLLRLWYGKRKLSRIVIFDFSARHLVSGTDTTRLNTLFGIDYLLSYTKESAHFACKWNPDTNKVELFVVTHVYGQREAHRICEINWHVAHRLTIKIHRFSYEFLVSSLSGIMAYKTLEVYTGNKSKWGAMITTRVNSKNPSQKPITIEIKTK